MLEKFNVNLVAAVLVSSIPRFSSSLFRESGYSFDIDHGCFVCSRSGRVCGCFPDD